MTGVLTQHSLQKMAAHDSTQSQLGATVTGQWGSQHSLLEMSHLIWMGDLNYRLNSPDAEVTS